MKAWGDGATFLLPPMDESETDGEITCLRLASKLFVSSPIARVPFKRVEDADLFLDRALVHHRNMNGQCTFKGTG